ncbi:hypothetical protein, partial [Actinophytocola sp.]|uniref:hypothetical protein n=1 Tax=Actinophytocola sp. TaxID=1872138 RepID=UPI002D7F9516
GTSRLVFETPEPAPGRFGVQFGPEGRTVLVLDPGTPLWFSAAPIAGPNGRLTRDWRPLPAADGVAITQVPDTAVAGDARVLARPTRPAADDRGADAVRLEWSAEYVEHAKAGRPTQRQGRPTGRPALAWTDEAARRMMVGNPARPIPYEAGEPMLTFVDGLEQAGMLDFGFHYQGWGSWSVIGGLSDGRTVIVSEIVEDARPSRIFAVLLNPDGSVSDAVRGDQPDPSVPLPVHLRLPDHQGWIVADYGAALRYRAIPGGPLLDAARDAALVPDTALQVEVSRGGAATVVGLPR